MAPVRVTDDYYAILAVEQIATTEAITKSYRRLAFVLHPDRNPRSDATAAFQLVGICLLDLILRYSILGANQCANSGFK